MESKICESLLLKYSSDLNTNQSKKENIVVYLPRPCYLESNLGPSRQLLEYSGYMNWSRL